MIQEYAVDGSKDSFDNHAELVSTRHPLSDRSNLDSAYSRRRAPATVVPNDDATGEASEKRIVLSPLQGCPSYSAL